MRNNGRARSKVSAKQSTCLTAAVIAVPVSGVVAGLIQYYAATTYYVNQVKTAINCDIDTEALRELCNSWYSAGIEVFKDSASCSELLDASIKKGSVLFNKVFQSVCNMTDSDNLSPCLSAISSSGATVKGECANETLNTATAVVCGFAMGGLTVFGARRAYHYFFPAESTAEKTPLNKDYNTLPLQSL